jgi:hypothetical protein
MTSRRIISSLSFALFAGCLTSAAACGPFHSGSSSNDAYIEFVNESLDQADVYAVPAAGDRIRIGTVSANTTSRLTIPQTFLSANGTVNIVAQIFASTRVVRSGRISLTPGEGVQITLPSSENTLTVLPATSP